jgi:hypothetical protein
MAENNLYLALVKKKLHENGDLLELVDFNSLTLGKSAAEAAQIYWDICKIAVRESEVPSYKYINKARIFDLASLYLMILTSNCTDCSHIKKYISLPNTENINCYELFCTAINIEPRAIRFILMYREELGKHQLRNLIKRALKKDIKVLIYLEDGDLNGNILTALNRLATDRLAEPSCRFITPATLNNYACNSQ